MVTAAAACAVFSPNTLCAKISCGRNEVNPISSAIERISDSGLFSFIITLHIIFFVKTVPDIYFIIL